MTGIKFILALLIVSLGIFAVFKGQLLQKKIYASVPPGTHLLGTQDLIVWNDLCLKLCERSERYCANLWDGGISPDEEERALSLLSKDDLEEWIRISELSSRVTPPPPESEIVSEEDFKQGLRKIRPMISNVELERLRLALYLKDKASRQDAASAMKSLLRNANLSPELRDRFIRYLFSQRLKR